MPPKRKLTATSVDEFQVSPTDVAQPDLHHRTLQNQPPKRHRVSRACDQCRAAREKCDGVQPSCFPCVSQHRECTYATRPKKRGLQAGYIRTLEVTLAWLFDRLPDCEKAVEHDLLHEARLAQDFLVDKHSDRLQRRWQKSKSYKHIDCILSGGDASRLSPDKSLVSEVDDSETDEQHDGFGCSRNRLTGNAQSTTSATPNDGITNEFASARPKIRLPGKYWRLIDIYFGYTHCWLPILEKQELLKTVQQLPPNGFYLGSGSIPSTYAELWAAMALAAVQHNGSVDTSVQAQVTATPDADELYRTARSLIPPEDSYLDIGHARAFLILALINIGKKQYMCSSIQIGCASRIILRPSGPQTDARATTAISMGCHILDSFIDMCQGFTPSLLAASSTTRMSVAEDGLDEWLPWTACEGFGAASQTASRSPAYAFSTFNELYNLCCAVREQGLELQQRDVSRQGVESINSKLRHALRQEHFHTSFVQGHDKISMVPPSAHALRLLLSWATAKLASPSQATFAAFLSASEQSVRSFGACGAPPFLGGLLESLRQGSSSFGDLGADSRRTLLFLDNSISRVWTGNGAVMSAASKMARGDVSGAADVRHSVGAGIAPVATGALDAEVLAVQPICDTPTPRAIPNQSLGLEQYSLDQTLSSISPAQPVQAITPQNLASTTYTEPAKLGAFGQASEFHTNFVTSPLETSLGQRRRSFETVSLDYDALLDNLSSMGYIDRVDTDPQFMANLGFAPDSDMSELLARDFV